MAGHPEMQICQRRGRKRMNPPRALSGQRDVPELIGARKIVLCVPDPWLTANRPYPQEAARQSPSCRNTWFDHVCRRYGQTRTLRRSPMRKKSQRFSEDIGQFLEQCRRMAGVHRRARRSVSAISPGVWDPRAKAATFQSTIRFSW